MFYLCEKTVPPRVRRGTPKRFCSKNCATKYSVNALRTTRKLEAVALLGGKCKRCGFDKHPAALQFHHRDPALKEFSMNRGTTMSMERIRQELEKCDLLCANCHAIHHFEESASVAQAVERRAEDAGVGGASPSRSAIYIEPDPPPHGVRARYTGRYHCRCDLCKEAQRVYQRGWKQRRETNLMQSRAVV